MIHVARFVRGFMDSRATSLDRSRAWKNGVVLGSTSLLTSRGLIQTINPSLEQFRRAICSTAPNFRPFEKGDDKHLHEAPFLRSEESGDEGSDSENEDEASDIENEDEANDTENEDGDVVSSTYTPSQQSLSKIYIDEVFDAAQL